MSEACILVVDDEVYIRDLVSSALRIAGFDTLLAADGPQAIEHITRSRPDLVVLDVGLPGFDGFEVCRRLRAEGDATPVIFLTARDAARGPVSAASPGAATTTSPSPSASRSWSAGCGPCCGAPGAEPTVGPLRYADLEIDEASHAGAPRRPADRAVAAPSSSCCATWSSTATGCVSKNQILDQVWQYDFGGNASVVENYISYLRKKVDAEGPRLIHTVRGFGYVLRLDQ